MNKQELIDLLWEENCGVDYITNYGSPSIYDKQYLILGCDGEVLENKLNMNIGEMFKILEVDNAIYEDEILYCENCNCYHYINNGYYNNYITLPKSYDVICKSYFDENLEEFLDEFINDYDIALYQSFDEEMEELGYSKIDKNYFDNIKPKDVFNVLKENYNNIVFYIVSCTPFEVEYSAYVKNDEE